MRVSHYITGARWATLLAQGCTHNEIFAVMSLFVTCIVNKFKKCIDERRYAEILLVAKRLRKKDPVYDVHNDEVSLLNGMFYKLINRVSELHQQKYPALSKP